jgi:uncharacterized membrane protein YgcG
MKLLIRSLLGIGILAFLLICPAAYAQNVQDFTIESFQSDYYLGRNQADTSVLHTVEEIDAVFPSYDQNHGILRSIPESYQGHTVSLNVRSVTDGNGAPRPYTTYGQNGNLVLKIGDKNQYVHGSQIYKITYDQKNVISILSDHDEFYWDVNGDQWQQLFGKVTANLHISPDLTSVLQNRKVCYVGPRGSTDQSRCQFTGPKDSGSGFVLTAQTGNLNPGETLTIVSAFNHGTFKLGPEIAQAERAKKLKYAAIAGGVVAPALLSSLFLFNRWRKYGRDPRGRGVIIPEYQPPKGLNALTSNYIFKENLETKAISALIVELATRKYISIYEINEQKRLQPDSITYNLKLIKDPNDLSEDEQRVIKMFFTSNQVGAEAHLNKLRNKLADDVAKLNKTLGANLTKQGYFRGDPNKAGTIYAGVGIALKAAGLAFLIFTRLFPLIDISLILAGLAFLIFSRYMPSRSESGVAVHNHILGLRDYIKLAEADRLKFLQSPQGAEKIQEAGLKPDDPLFKVKLFESLLPYAMIFGLEKDWAKQFEDVYKTPPDWYNGNWAAFNAGYLVSSLGDFSSASAVTFTAPHSSGGSGFGGGSSGGGGGGGGGGGW